MHRFGVNLALIAGQSRANVQAVVISTPGTLPATDTFESYVVGADLNGLNGGTNFSSSAAYVSSWNQFSILVHDSFEQYTVGANLNTLSGGTNDSSTFGGAYVSR